MHVYVLHFDDAPSLAQAFDCLLDADEVESCLVEPQEGRIRFTAPEKEGGTLVQAIYDLGGLSWCSRHELDDAKD